MSDQPVIYVPGLPSLSSKDIALYNVIHNARLNLVTQLDGAGYHVEDIDGQASWLKNMAAHAEHSDAFIFPPMTSLPEKHPRFKQEAAQRWFEFFSLVTGVHIGNPEKFRNGIAKPCVVMDPDGQWSSVIDLLHDLHHKGMFTSNVEDIVQVVHGSHDGADYHALNHEAVKVLGHALTLGTRKARSDITLRYPESHMFEPFRKEVSRHPFGIAIFGSATTHEKAYTEPTFQLAKLAAQRGWRLSSGAGTDGCMGAADAGFEEGRKEFNRRYPNAKFKPAHIGVSTQSILRLEGPPQHIDQLIITDDIYDRMRIIIRGQKAENPKLRVRDATRVLFVAPGGTGTLHEFAALVQLITSGGMMTDRKIVLLDVPSHTNAKEGFWDPLIKVAKKLGFDSMVEVAKTPEEAIAIADRAYTYWLERHQEYASLPHPTLASAPARRVI